MRHARHYTVLEVPSILGLGPTGVEDLPSALLDAGFASILEGRRAERVESLPYSARRDPDIHLLNPENIREYSVRMSNALGPIVDRGEFPILLGGDCSILLGSMLALRKRGRYGLLFLDGHMDFYSPDTSPTGEAADMDLALVTGRGPSIVSDLEGLTPLVRDEDVVAFGYRDEDDVSRDGGPLISGTAILDMSLFRMRRLGIEQASYIAIERLRRRELSGFWIHLDVDVLDDAVMPAVDYRMPGGMSYDELASILKAAIESECAIGLEVTIYNPRLDPDRTIAKNLVSCICVGLGVRIEREDVRIK